MFTLTMKNRRLINVWEIQAHSIMTTQHVLIRYGVYCSIIDNIHLINVFGASTRLRSITIQAFCVAYSPHNLGPLLLTWFNFNPSMDK